MPVPTPVFVQGEEPLVKRVKLLVKDVSPGCSINNLHLWDGDRKAAWWDDIDLRQEVLSGEVSSFDVKGDLKVEYGLNICILANFHEHAGMVRFHLIGAGVEFGLSQFD